MKFFLSFYSLILLILLRVSAQNVEFSQSLHLQQLSEAISFVTDDPEWILDNAPNTADVALDFSPNYSRLGYQYLKAGKLEQAKVAFETFTTLAPEEGIGYFGLADYYYLTKNYTEASRYYEEAARRGMSNATARAQMASTARLYYHIEEDKGGCW